ncbi:MAG: cytochrome c oxidase subunit II [bacterium]|nr:cytochrome c oxidase subunit II [bacterium]
MSTVDDRPLADSDGPEEPTNRPESASRVQEWMRRPYARHILILSSILTVLVLPCAWLVIYFMNLTGAPASGIMTEIERTMFVFTIVSAPLMALTLAILIYSLVGWGCIGGDEPPMQDSPAIRNNTVGVTLWITVTSVLAAFLVIWGMAELATITSYSYGSVAPNQQPNSQKPIDINVTGQQWVWTFEYPESGKVTTNTLVVPIDVPIYFNVTSLDVVHSFWVVELGVKVDANPGAITNTGVTPNKLGTFNIRCAELCGMNHAYMQTQIHVVTQQDFDAWIREMGGTKTA